MKETVQYNISGTNASEIAASIEREIRNGRIIHGAILPSVRVLALSLKVSPTTVAAAYRTLRLRGLLSWTAPIWHARESPAPTVDPSGSDSAAWAARSGQRQSGYAYFPCCGCTLARVEFRPRLYGETINRPRVLERARQQFETDKIPATSLAVMGGALDAIERVLQAHRVRETGLRWRIPVTMRFLICSEPSAWAEPVSVDDFGLIPDDLERTLKGGVAACIFTPRAQNPTGAALDEQRAARSADIRHLWRRAGH